MPYSPDSPETSSPVLEENPRKAIIVIDDTLDMELKKHGLMQQHDMFSQVFWQKGVDTIHVQDQAAALRVLARMKQDYRNSDLDDEYSTPIAPENITIISDYKIQHPGQPEEWGPNILAEIAKDPEYRPANLFLMSKSGFRDQDKAKLDALGAQYFHTNELFFTVAAKAKNEALMEVFSQRSTTHTFREWYNKEFGTEMPLDQYRSPSVANVEKGRVPVEEVIRRVEAKEITHAEAMQLLDVQSVRAAFRSRVDASQATVSQSIEHGIEGPSVAGRLAYSAEDIAQIRKDSPNAPIILVLDHDYSPADDAALSQANGAILLARGAQHLKVWAQDRGMPVVFANKNDYADFSLQNGVLMRHEGLLEPSPFAKAGDWLSLDGTNFTVYQGKLPVIEPTAKTRYAAEEMARIGNHHNKLTWHFKNDDATISDHTGTNVMVNASSVQQVAFAKQTPGVRGIGLLRTEPMMREESRRLLLLKALLAEGEAKTAALQEFTKLHIADLEPVFAAQGEKFPINVRLFDFPPAEFFPDPADAEAIAKTAQDAGIDAVKLQEFCAKVHGENLRGVGFAQAYPEIAEAQINAIFTAASHYPEITPRLLIPAVRDVSQVKSLRQIMKAHAAGTKFALGSMIETKEMAPSPYAGSDVSKLEDVVHASDFLCLGTNDLTEELLGIKRNDLEGQLQWSHRERNPINPFAEFAPEVERAVSDIMWRVREWKPDMPTTLCGDHATRRKTIEFCQDKLLSAISVPASTETITQALVETGRASLLEAIAHREQMDVDLTARQKARDDAEAGILPADVENIAPDVLAKSPMAFIFIEDDHTRSMHYMEEMQGRPVLLCETISDALKTADAMRKQGKHVHFYCDANVAIYSYEDHQLQTQHSDCDAIHDINNTPKGVLFARAIEAGHIKHVTTSDISLISSFLVDKLPEGIRKYSKLSDYTDGNLKEDMDERVAKAKPVTAATVRLSEASPAEIPETVTNLTPDDLATSPIAFIFIDDRDTQRKKYAEEFEGYPALLCENISDGLKAADAMRKQGKIVHIYTDGGARLYKYEESDSYHPACDILAEMDTRPGILAGASLANAAGDGQIEGLHKGDVSVISGSPSNVKMQTGSGVKCFGKSGNYLDYVHDDVRERLYDAHNRSVGKYVLPDGVMNLSSSQAEKSSVVFLLQAENTDGFEGYEQVLGKYPTLLSGSVEATQKAAALLHAQGKQVYCLPAPGLTRLSQEADTLFDTMDAYMDAASQLPQTTINVRSVILDAPPAPTTQLPKNVTNLSPYTLDKSNGAFILIEDERKLQEYNRRHFRGMPVVMCDNISDALKTLDALHAQGKHVRVIADAGAPRLNYADKEPHPLCVSLKDELSNGAELAHAIAAGKIKGLEAKDTTVWTAAYFGKLPAGVKCYGKLDDTGMMNIQQNMDAFLEEVKAKGPYVHQEVPADTKQPPKKRGNWFGF